MRWDHRASREPPRRGSRAPRPRQGRPAPHPRAKAPPWQRSAGLGCNRRSRVAPATTTRGKRASQTWELEDAGNALKVALTTHPFIRALYCAALVPRATGSVGCMILPLRSIGEPAVHIAAPLTLADQAVASFFGRLHADDLRGRLMAGDFEEQLAADGGQELGFLFDGNHERTHAADHAIAVIAVK